MVMLSAAHHQLFSRPPEEHFESFEALRADAKAQKDRCSESDAKDTAILFSEDGQSVHFGEKTLLLAPYSLAQMAILARVPLPLLDRLNPETRARVLNQTFPRNRRYKVALQDGERLRCVVSDRDMFSFFYGDKEPG